MRTSRLLCRLGNRGALYQPSVFGVSYRCMGGSRSASMDDIERAAVSMPALRPPPPERAANSDHKSNSSRDDEDAKIRLGFFRSEKEDDIAELVENFTAPSLAKALRDREETLQLCAALARKGDLAELTKILNPFHKDNVTKKRRKATKTIDLRSGLSKHSLTTIQRLLHRQPREVAQSAKRRASVLVPLCNVNGVASVLFERRSGLVRSHKFQVCFPGGMVDEDDSQIIDTSIREMEEEIGVSPDSVDILGVLRCDWTEVSSLTGVSVTPVVGFIGDYEKINFKINKDEVDQVFTVPIESLLNPDMWEEKEHGPSAFKGGPFVIWGLTAYILRRFVKEILGQCKVVLK